MSSISNKCSKTSIFLIGAIVLIWLMPFLVADDSQLSFRQLYHGSPDEAKQVKNALLRRDIACLGIGGGLSFRLSVPREKWEESRIAAEEVGVTISAGNPLRAFYAFSRGEFEVAIALCIKDMEDIDGDVSVPLHFELIDQSRRQMSVRRSAEVLYSKQWADLKRNFPRESQIRRLIALMPLSTAMIKDGRIAPVATLFPLDDERLAVAEEKEIDPLVELVAMKLTPAECELLAPGMTYDWLLVPTNAEVAPFGVSVIRPCTRDFLCQLICNACGRADLIHLNSLSRDEWRDEAKVRSLLARVVQMPK